MAFRSLLKMKINSNLPLRFLRNRTLVLTRPVSPIAQPEAPRLFPLLGMTQNLLFARQMGTSRSSSIPRGSYRMNDKEDDDEEEDDDVDVDFDEDMDIELDGDDDGEYDMDDDEEEAEEEPRRKKSYGKKL